MDLDDLNLDIKIEVTSIEELREIRKEMQKIAKAKKQIDTSEESDNPLDDLDIDPKPDRDPDPFYPDYPKRDFPDFIMDTETSESGFEIDDDEAFSTVGQMDEELFNDRSMR